jgi:hypothetical protein
MNWRLRMGRFYKVVKHALGSFNSEDGYEKDLEDKIATVRIVIVCSNLICVWVIIVNVIRGWVI